MARILIQLMAVITTATFPSFADAVDSGCGSPRDQVGISGSFSSMNYPNNYNDNANCNWVIKVPTGYGIKIEFNSKFELESYSTGSGCHDYVQINQGKKLCGRTTAPEDTTYQTNKLDVKFISDRSNTEAGFRIDWKYVVLMPFMKRRPTASNVKATSVTITTPAWRNGTDGGDGTVIKYRLQYKMRTATQWTNHMTEYSASSNTHSWTVSGLMGGARYQFRVVLLNEIDRKWGRPGSIVEAKTPCPDEIPKIKGITTGIKESDSWPTRAYLLVEIETFQMPAICFKKYDVHFDAKDGSSRSSVHVNSLIYQKEIKQLKPCTEYNVYVILLNTDDKSFQSAKSTQKTAEDIPGPVNKPAAYSQGKTIRITWTEPTVKNGVITSYHIEHKLVGYGHCKNVAGSTVSSPDLPITTRTYDLPENVMCPYCAYDIRVMASTAAGRGNPYAFSRIFTAAAAPTATPPQPTASKTSRQMRFTWNAVPCEKTNGPFMSYPYKLTSGSKVVKTDEVQTTSVTLTQLTPYTVYGFQVAYRNQVGQGPYGTVVTVVTDEEVPGPPRSIQVVESTVHSLKIAWTLPEFPNGVLKNYQLICAPVFSYDAVVNGNKDKYIVKSEPTPTSVEKTFTDLTPATEYNCSIRAQTAVGYGPAVSVKNRTRSQRDDISTEGDSAVTVKKISATTITIDIKELPKNAVKSGKLEAIRIGVKYGPAKKNRRKRATSLTSTEHTELTGVEDAEKNGRTSYIAAELDPDFKGRFVIGDNKTYGGYYNPPLKTGETYYVLYGIVTNAGGSNTVTFIQLDKGQTLISKKGGGPNMGVAVGIPIAILIISAAVITAVVLVIRKRRAASKPPAAASTYVELDPVIEGPKVDVTEGEYAEVGIDLPVGIDHTIPCSGLLQHYKEVIGGKAEDFEAEFKSLPNNLVKPCEVALANKPLNRYQNIIAYDHSRVILNPIGDIVHDYINADYVDGYDCNKVYIASQGPKEETIVDMWRIIWQERCPAIVMLTNLMEGLKVKCTRYWPETTPGKATYGPFEVELVREEHFTDYVKRTLKISLEGKAHHVTQYHFTAWPDHGVPMFASSLLNLRTVVMRDYGKHYGKRPLLVHCSAGVGRTGTFIAIDYLIREGEAEDKVNIYECAKKLRGYRPNMIQNLKQYQHVHDAMAEYFLVGITTCDTEVYRVEYQKLIKVKPGESKCKLEEQFSHLTAFGNTITPSTDALTVYADRNRNPDIVPTESTRTVLTQPVAGADDYINAVYLTGYGDKDTYIATQHPLPNTVKDFWRLVEDMGLSTVVMMNVIKEGDKLCPVYWPEEGQSLEFGPLMVEGRHTDASHPDIVIRDFEISRPTTGAHGNPARQVRQFHLQNWPDGRATPKTASSIVELIEMVQLWQQQTGNKKILVQCLDGASQSGVFCLAHSVIEKVKVDHEVDVFQYARLLRTNRPQLINTYMQYKFIHDVILEYLSQFDTYANFKEVV